MAGKLAYATALAALLFLAVAVFLLAQNASLSSQTENLQKQKAKTEASLAALDEKHSSLQSRCSLTESALRAELANSSASLLASEARASLLSYRLGQAESQLAKSRSELEAERGKAAAIASELTSLESSINESISWFKGNSMLPQSGSWSADIFQKRILSDCAESGNLNLACIAYLMENTAFSIHYRADIEKGKMDYLQSVNETIALGWGDCEDYSLLFKATLNSLKQQSPSLVPVAFEGGGESDFRVYPKEGAALAPGEDYWYVPNARGAPFAPLSTLHPYVICFAKSAQGGHCVVALSEKKAASSASLSELSGSYIFEPQTGLYLGKIGETLFLCPGDAYYFEPGSIRLIIAEDDLYFYRVGGGWTGYGDYLEKVGKARESLS